MKIRRFEERDFLSLYRLLSDENVMRYLEEPFDEERTLSFLNDNGLNESPRIYAVEEDEKFIGYVIFHEYDEKAYEIGWVLYPKYWRKGNASKLTEMLIEKGKQMNKDLVIECVPEQVATKRIAEKYGFSYMGNEDGLEIYRLDHRS